MEVLDFDAKSGTSFPLCTKSLQAAFRTLRTLRH